MINRMKDPASQRLYLLLKTGFGGLAIAAIGFLIAVLGYTSLGWKVGILGAVIGNVCIVAFGALKIFSAESQ